MIEQQFSFYENPICGLANYAIKLKLTAHTLPEETP